MGQPGLLGQLAGSNAAATAVSTRAHVRKGNPQERSRTLASGARADVAVPTIGDGLRDVAALHSKAERRLYSALSGSGVTVRLKPVVEGYELDFAIDTAARPVDVEVDGIHHLDTRGRQRRQDLARQAVLQRLRWQVIRLPAWRCLADPDDAARTVIEAIDPAGQSIDAPSLNIEPTCALAPVGLVQHPLKVRRIRRDHR